MSCFPRRSWLDEARRKRGMNAREKKSQPIAHLGVLRHRYCTECTPYSVRTTGCPVAKSYRQSNYNQTDLMASIISHSRGTALAIRVRYGVRSSSSTANSTENQSLVRTGNIKGRLLIVIVTNRRSPSSPRPQPPAFRQPVLQQGCPWALPSAVLLSTDPLLLCVETP